jgi:hypothetical protein
MGMNNEECGRWLAFDLECVSIEDAADYIEPVKAPANYKDADKIRAYIEDGTAKAIERAALDVDLARIAVLAMQDDAMSEPAAWYIEDERAERLMLQNFWSGITASMKLIGFCIRSYDLALLIRRSQLLGVSYPEISLDRYRSTQVIDLYDRLTFNGTVDGKKLDTYCRRFGIKVEDGITGADVAACLKAGDVDTVIKHARADVTQVVQLAQRLRLIQPVLSESAA